MDFLKSDIFYDFIQSSSGGNCGAYSAMQRQKEISAYFTSEQILPFGFSD